MTLTLKDELKLREIIENHILDISNWNDTRFGDDDEKLLRDYRSWDKSDCSIISLVCLWLKYELKVESDKLRSEFDDGILQSCITKLDLVKK